MSAPPSHPVGGRDYPRTLEEFEGWFSTEAACLDYLVQVRWGRGFRCPACDSSDAWETARGQRHCRECGRQTTPTAGTIFQGTRKPLRTWFRAMWWLTSQKYGANAKGLQRVLGLKSYETAWAWLHKLRRAMVRPGRDRLGGVVEVDETYVGGRQAGGAGRRRKGIAVVAIAAQEDGRGIGRIRMARVPNVSGASLVGFVKTAVVPGATVRTDAWRGYFRLPEHGYKHRSTNISKGDDPAHVAMPRVHRVAALLGRWWLGTYQGAIRPDHLDYYLDEFTFRFNRRRSRARGMLFYRLLEQAVQLDAVPLKRLLGGKRNRKM